MNNLKFALRQLTKSPGFTAVALLTLALGIGVNTTTFSLVNALLFRLPPYRDPNRLVQVFRTTPQSQFNRQAPANIRDEIEQGTVLQAASPYCFNNANLARPGEPAERITGLNVAGNFFDTLGMAPLLGRGLTRADDRPGHDDVIVVSEHFWRQKLGADPKALGTVLRLDGKAVTVVGVMPAADQDIMSFGNVDIWQPLGYGEEQWRIRNNQWLNLLGRLKPGVSLAQAQAESSTIAARLAHDFPAVNAGSGLSVLGYSYVRSAGGTRQVSWIIMGLTLSVLLIACVNLANLQLARTAGRVREHAVRIALGASRAQLVRQLLAESILLSLAGGALGLLVASWGNKLLSSRISTDVFSDAATGFAMPLDYRVMGFMLLASVGTGIVFGLMPAWIASRTNVNEALKQGSRGSTGDRSKHRLRQGLVVAELALAMASLAGAAFFVRGVQHLGRTDSGWDTGNLLTGNFVLSYNTYQNNDQVRRVVDRLESQLAAIPGVDHVAISGSVPIFYFSHTLNFLIEGRAAPPRGQEPLGMVERVTPGFFTTLKYHLLAGRFLGATDRADSRQVVVIDSAMAKQFWPKGDAIGHRIGGTDPSNPGWQEIVGIVNEVQLAGNPSVPETHFQMYRPFTQDPEHWLTLSVHSVGPVGNLAETVRLTVARVDPDLAVYGLATAHDSIEKAGKNMSLVGQLLSFAAALGLLLSLVGIYGVIANLAVQRTQEIGIRMALGAEARAVLWLILRNGVKLAAVGTGIGLVLAFLLTWGLEKGMPFIPGRDPALVLGLAALLVGATLFACWLPAQRATRVNPVEALRAE